MKHSICLDGGGTKTSFTLFSPEGKMISQTVDKTIHLQHQDYETAKEVLEVNTSMLIKAANLKADDVVISAGLAGYGSNQIIKEKFNILFADVFADQEYYLTSDGHVALLGALDNQEGILVVAGTGSIAYRLKDGELSRVGGWGAVLGDEGSAFSIAEKLLKEFTHQADGRSKKTALYDGVMRNLDLQDPYDLVKYINTIIKGSRHEIAQISRVNYQLALEGEETALRIFNEAAEELAAHVNALAGDDENVLVSYVGGVFNSKQFVLEPMSKMIKSCVLVEPKNTPDYGAYLNYKLQSK